MTHQQIKTSIINFVFPMQEQSLSVVSFQSCEEDRYLEHFFQVEENNEDMPNNGIEFDSDKMNQENYSVTFNPEELEKGYDSDEGPAKRAKNKKIKKKKPMFVQRDQQNKKKRLKIYVQSLQNRILELQAENEKLKKLNQQNISYIRKLNDSQQIMNGFMIDRQKLFARIQKLLAQEKPDIPKMQIHLENIRRRQGCFGNQRIKAVNYYFKHMLNLIVPNVQRYVADAAYYSTDIFSPDYHKNLEIKQLELIRKISPDDQLVKNFLEKKGEIIGLRSKFNQKSLELYGNLCELIMYAREIEKISQFCGAKVDKVKLLQFTCYAQKYKQKNNTLPQNVQRMYEQIQKCNRFSYVQEAKERLNTVVVNSS